MTIEHVALIALVVLIAIFSFVVFNDNDRRWW
jgi:hypothetical protein